MDMISLDGALEIQNGFLTLTAVSLPGSSLDSLLVFFNGNQPITIGAATKVVGPSLITIQGTAAFMNMSSLNVTGLFSLAPDGTPIARIRFQLTDAKTLWKFSQSFPDLPPLPGYLQVATNSSGALLDSLALTDAAFVLSTATGTDDKTSVPLTAGLNFVAALSPTGLFGLFSAIIDDTNPLTLYGTIIMPLPGAVVPPLQSGSFAWQQTSPVAGIQLQASLDNSRKLKDPSIGKLQLDSFMFRIYSPISTDWMEQNSTYQPVAAVTATVSVPSANLSLELTAEDVQCASITLGGAFKGFSLQKLEQLADVTNGADLFHLLPADIQKLVDSLGELALEGLGLSFTGGLEAASIDYVYLIIGMPGASWSIPELPFTLSNISAEFMISDPFGESSLSVVLGGEIAIADVPFDVTVSCPDLNALATLRQEATIPLQTVLKQYLPELSNELDASVNNLTISAMDVAIIPGSAYRFTARMADDPAWTIDVGPTSLTIENVYVDASHDSTGNSLSFGGGVQIGPDVSFDAAYDTPGDFYLRADLTNLKLSDLIAQFDELHLNLPSEFDLDIPQSYLLIGKQGSDLTLTVAATLDGFGLLAFTVKESTGKWGFAFGLEFINSDLSALNSFAGGCLSSIAELGSVFGLQKLMLVVSSLTDPGFSFPDMANFNTPSLANQGLTLPAQASGVVQGLNFYAQLESTSSREFQALANWLELKLDGTLGLVVAVSLPDPTQNSRVFAQVDQQLTSGLHVKGQLGAQLIQTTIDVFLSGEVDLSIGGKQLIFDLAAVVYEGGVLVAGSAQAVDGAGAPVATIGPVQFSNLGLMIGVDWEGIPSVGIAATIDVQNFESSIVIFIDSAMPSNSLVAGSISGVSLYDIAVTLAGQQYFPPELQDVMQRYGLRSVPLFTVPPAGAQTLADALNHRRLADIASAFSQVGGIQLPTASAQVLVVVDQPGAVWHLTSTSGAVTGTITHYSLTRQGDGSLAVSLDPQFYVAPQATTIGALTFPQGFEIAGELDDLILQAAVRITVAANQGIAVDVDISPIVFYSRDFFSLTDVTGQGGPHLSLSTYSQPNEPDPMRSEPHFFVSGEVSLAGLDMGSLSLNVSADGFNFSIIKDFGIIRLGLTARFSALNDFGASGNITAGLNQTVNCGPLGAVRVVAEASGDIAMQFQNNAPSATLNGTFNFADISEQFGYNLLDDNLGNLEKNLVNLVEQIIQRALGDPERWLCWLRDGVIDVDRAVENVGRVLRQIYNLAAADIAEKTRRILNYANSDVAAALHGAGETADAWLQWLNTSGIDVHQAAESVGQILRSVFALSVNDIAEKTRRILNYANSDVAVALHGAGETADAWLQWLKTSGIDVNQVAGSVGLILQSVFALSVNDIAAKTLSILNYNHYEIADALKAAGAGRRDVETALRSLGRFSEGDISKVLQKFRF